MNIVVVLLLLVLVVVLGALVGTLTGLLPGLHVNTVAPVVLGVVAPLALLFPEAGLWAALFLLAVAVVHTIVNVVPTLAAPLPDEGTDLVLLPLQRLAREGRAREALYVSVRASWLGGLSAALGILIVLLLVEAVPKVPARTAQVTVAAMVCMLIVQHRHAGHALTVFLLAGVAGLIMLDESLVGPFGGDGNVLLPVFSGLFALPMLYLALREPGVPDARPTGAMPERLRVSRWAPVVGTGCGLLVALFPGLTSATAGAFGRSVRQPAGDAEDVAMISAVDSANAIGNTAALVVWGATRSGASAAARVAWPGLVEAGPGRLAALALAVLLLALVCGSAIALGLGPRLVERLRRLDARALAGGAMIVVTLIILAHGGLMGLALAWMLVPLGLLPHRWQTPRALLMGFLLVPYLVSVGGVSG